MLKTIVPELFLKGGGINQWMNEGNIGRGFSFTKKGPGRKHNHSGSERRFKNINSISSEFDLRIKYGRISRFFIKRWDKHWSASESYSPSIMKRVASKFRNLFIK